MYIDHPTYPLRGGKIQKDWRNFSAHILKSEDKVWLFEGPLYLNWDLVINAIPDRNKFEFINFKACQLERNKIINKINAHDLQLTASFGVYCTSNILDFYSKAKIFKLQDQLRSSQEKSGTKIIVYGSGCSAIKLPDSRSVWFEHPIINLISDPLVDTRKFYGSHLTHPAKSYHYIDQPITDNNRANIFNHIDLYFYLPSIKNHTFTSGTAIRENIRSLATKPFRLKPVFFEKMWGGLFLRTYLKKEKDFENIAGSFEMVSRENQVVFTENGLEIEVPFDLFCSEYPHQILGQDVAERCGKSLPFRLNLTDTIGGDKLSCQLHPYTAYLQKRFRMDDCMEEKYYVIETEGDARINLGFVNSIDINEFKQVVKRSETEKIPVDISQYVKSWCSEKGKVFYILPGTIHNIGENNLVMEVIASSRIITLRLYDYLRKNKDGKLRSLNVDQAWDTLNSEAKEYYVKKNMIPEKKTLRKGDDWAENIFVPPDPTRTSISEVSFLDVYEDTTSGKRFHALTLVDGDKIEIESADYIHSINYLETIFVPAAANEYKLVNSSGNTCKVLVVKPHI